MDFARDYSDFELEIEEALSFTLDFGKHRGRTLGELAASWEERGYLQYLLSTNPTPGLKSAIETVLGAVAEPECTLAEAKRKVVHFGQFKGLSLESIIAQKGGKRYLDWVGNWENCDRYLKEAINAVCQKQK
jgi:hypothetical protein